MSARSAACRPMFRWARIALAAAAVAGTAALPAYGTPQYAITDLGILYYDQWGPPTERRIGINDHGQIVGHFANGDVWDNGTWVDLDIPGPLCDINNAGQMVGNFRVLVSPGHFYDGSFLYEDGDWTDLQTGIAIAINTPGQVLMTHGLWDGGVLTEFGIASGSALGLNDAGRTVGFTGGPDGGYRAFLWADGTLIDLGTLGYTSARAYDINNADQIVGSIVQAGVDQTAFLWDQGQTTPLGGSLADAINEAGQVVGWGFLWDNGAYYNLDDLIPAGTGWTLERGFDINSDGWIVGKGIFAGQQHGFLLTPIPEPATLGLFALLLVARRRSGLQPRPPRRAPRVAALRHRGRSKF